MKEKGNCGMAEGCLPVEMVEGRTASEPDEREEVGQGRIVLM